MDCTCPRSVPVDRPDLHNKKCLRYGPAPVPVLRMAERMKAWILDHANHGNFCTTEFCNHCPHDERDSRVACAEHPCNCGLAGILQDLKPSILFQLEDEEEETPLDVH